MSDNQSFLREVHIKNFLSLHDVTLPLKQLTVLVGPNASGKSNILNALNLLRKMMNNEKLPSFDAIQDTFWAGGAESISFQLQVQVDETPTHYQLELIASHQNPVRLEELFINQIKVISVHDGQGHVTDEANATTITPYRPLKPKLALKSAGDYGDKPVTAALNQFIQEWEFYNFETRGMRRTPVFLLGFNATNRPNFSNLDDDGSLLSMILANWAEHDEERFELVNEALYECANLKIDKRLEDDEVELYLQEGYKNPIPLEKASDGTLRLLAYYILLNQSDLPPLIAIEEPEINLHPGALSNIASVLEQLAERTQVIITTHSSQLLDAFNPENLSSSLGVILLRNIPSSGTKVINLEETRRNRAAFEGWIDDFGIGSAIFESELLQDIMESQA